MRLANIKGEMSEVRRESSLDDFVHAHFEPPPSFGFDAQVREYEAALIPQVEQARHDASSNVFAFTSSQIVQFLLTVLRYERSETEVGMSESR